MGKNSSFVISAIVAVIIYISVFFIFFYYSYSNVTKHVDASSKVTVLQLDIVLEVEKIKKKEIVVKSEVKNTKIAKDIVKKSVSSSAKQRSNLKSLFANVKTKAKKVSKEKILNVKQSTVASRFKSKFEKEKKVDKLKLSDLSKSKLKQTSQSKNKKTKSIDSNDLYFTKINNIVYNGWKPTIYNMTAKVLVEISNNGTFSFKFVQYSNNPEFDNQLSNYLKKESFKRYPISPTGDTVTIEIIFRAEG